MDAKGAHGVLKWSGISVESLSLYHCKIPITKERYLPFVSKEESNLKGWTFYG